MQFDHVAEANDAVCGEFVTEAQQKRGRCLVSSVQIFFKLLGPLGQSFDACNQGALHLDGRQRNLDLFKLLHTERAISTRPTRRGSANLLFAVLRHSEVVLQVLGAGARGIHDTGDKAM
jgi:hypothetical protein